MSLGKGYLQQYGNVSGYAFYGNLQKIVNPCLHEVDVGEFYNDLALKLYDSRKSNELDAELDRIQQHLLDAADNAGSSVIFKAQIRATVNGSIFTPFIDSASVFQRDSSYAISSTVASLKPRTSRIFAQFPLVKDVYYVDIFGAAHLRDNIATNLVLSLLNPIKLVDQLLTFLHMGANRLLDIGVTKGGPTPIPQAILKGIIGGIITLIKIPVTILKPFGEILPSIVNNLVIQPAVYITNKAQKSFETNPRTKGETGNAHEAEGTTSYSSDRILQSIGVAVVSNPVDEIEDVVPIDSSPPRHRDVVIEEFRSAIQEENNQERISTLISEMKTDKFLLNEGLAACCAQGSPEVVLQLVSAGADVDATISRGTGAPMTPLMIAAELNKPKIIQALIDSDASVNNVTLPGGTALLSAAANPSFESLELLITVGADVNVADVLYVSVRQNQLVSAAHLLENGADYTAQHEYYKQSPEELARTQLKAGNAEFQRLVDKIDELKKSASLRLV
jgi:hypothetical protein